MIKSTLIAMTGVLLVTVAAACGGDEETPMATPVAPVPKAAATVSAATPRPSPSPATPAVLESPAAHARIVAKVMLTLRSGPGIEYPDVGYLMEGTEALIRGRVPGNLWYQIECPQGLEVMECWIVGDKQYVSIESEAVIPEVAAPAVPTAMRGPLPGACGTSRPVGWTPHRISSGEVLTDVAVRFEVDVSKLHEVNCLTTETLVPGRIVYVPGAKPVSSGLDDTVAEGVDAAVDTGVWFVQPSALSDAPTEPIGTSEPDAPDEPSESLESAPPP